MPREVQQSKYSTTGNSSSSSKDRQSQSQSSSRHHGNHGGVGGGGGGHRSSSDRDRDRNQQPLSSSKDRNSSTSSSSSRSASASSNSNRKVEIESRSTTRGEKERSTPSKDDSKLKVPPKPVPKPRDVYESVIDFESKRALSLDLDEHLDEFNKISNRIEMIMYELYEMKMMGTLTPAIFKQRRKECLFLLSSIREMSRMSKLRLRITKDHISEQKQTVDADHLRLQNLIYEATHLNDQVSAAQDYKGIDEEIELIPLETFAKEVPDKLEAAKEDPHLLKLARLEYEYKQRQRLAEKCIELEKSKKIVSEEMGERITKLNSITPVLNKILEAARPLEEYFELEISEIQELKETAQYLPIPLYVVFVSSTAYAEYLSDSDEPHYQFKVKIYGDVEAAQKEKATITEPRVRFKKEENVNESPMEIDNDEVVEQENEEDDEMSKRRSLKKRISVYEEKVDLRTRILKKHPLHVEWTLRTENSEVLTLKFYYLTRFRIITVEANLSLPNLSPKLSDFFRTNDHVLCDLFDKDSGEQSPNPSSTFILESADIENFGLLIPEIGRPYNWAQILGGLLFLPLEDAKTVTPDMNPKSEPKRSLDHVPGVHRLLQDRLTNKVNLLGALKSLESKTLDLPAIVIHALPTRAADSISFTSWEVIDFDEYQRQECGQDLIFEKVVSSADIFIKLIIEREQEKLTAYISIKHNYPEVASTFALHLTENDAEKDSIHGIDLRKIEQHLNCDIPALFEKMRPSLLLIQLRILIDRMDNIELNFDMIRSRLNKSLTKL